MIRQGIPRELFYDLGDQDSAQFNVDSNGTLKLTYTADKGDYKRYILDKAYESIIISI